MQFPVIDLGRIGYPEALEIQREHHQRVLWARTEASAPPGVVLMVEHDPVITVSAKAARGDHLLAGREALARAGVAVEPTDRGGDITYHGPGQIVCYPIVDLERLGLRLGDYLRLLEGAIIDTLARFGLRGLRDPSATGVWVASEAAPETPHAKIAAIGIRVRRWVTLHGLALNVRPDLAHFGLIVPCGLHGRPVTSMQQELGEACPPVEVVRAELAARLGDQLSAERTRA